MEIRERESVRKANQHPQRSRKFPIRTHTRENVVGKYLQLQKYAKPFALHLKTDREYFRFIRFEMYRDALKVVIRNARISRDFLKRFQYHFAPKLSIVDLTIFAVNGDLP